MNTLIQHVLRTINSTPLPRTPEPAPDTWADEFGRTLCLGCGQPRLDPPEWAGRYNLHTYPKARATCRCEVSAA